jgi:phage/plasmid-associated DNA primase
MKTEKENSSQTWDYTELTKMFQHKKKEKTLFETYDYITNKTHGIPASGLIEYYKGYSLALHNKDKSKWNQPPIFGLAENLGNEQTCPLITEFEFRFSDKNKRNELDDQMETDDFSKEIIAIHHQVIKEFFVLSYQQSELLAVMCKSRLVRQGSIIVFRVRFQFPYCRCPRDLMKGKMRERILDLLADLDTDSLFFSSTATEGDNEKENEWENYIMPVRDVYPLVGSGDSEKIPPLIYDGIYGVEEDGEIYEEDLSEAYKIDNHKYLTERYIEDEKISFDDHGDEYETALIGLPIFLSVFFGTKEAKLRSTKKQKEKKDPDDNQEKLSLSKPINQPSVEEEDLSTQSGYSQAEKVDEEYENITDYEIFLELVECLSPKRYNTEMFLMDIGKCLFNIFGGDLEGLTVWTKYTNERSDKFDDMFCSEHYPSFEHENYISIKTIGWYAREDNSKKYQEFHEKYCLPKMKLAISRETFPHVLVAQAFYRFFWLDYIYAGGKKKTWYRFRRHRLEEISDDEAIRRDITEKFIPCFDDFRNQYMDEKSVTNRKLGSSEKARSMSRDFEKTIKMIGSLIDKLLSDGYRGALMRTIREYFLEEGFENKIDTNPGLLGVSNCVIELTPSGAFTRTGKPEDYITKRCGVSYQSGYDYNHKDVKDLLKYLRQVFPEKSIFDFMKKDISSLLYGRNVEKAFRVWSGNTNGSKSIFQAMLKKMFGDYYRDLPNEFYSQTKQNPSGSSPEMAQLTGARVVFSTEPDAGLNFKADKIKLITGSDSQFGRGNYKDGGSINPSYNAIMVLNRIPNISNLDEAAKRRFTITPFEGRWVDEDDDIDVAETFEDQIKEKIYWMDKRFEKQIPRLAMALLWLAVEYYQKYITEGHRRPDYIRQSMKDYWKANDPYICFIDEHIEKMEKEVECKKCADKDDDEKGCKLCNKGIRMKVDKDFKLRTKDIFSAFKKWLRTSDYSIKMPTQGQFTADMCTRDKLGKQEKYCWEGYRLKVIGDEDSDDDE